MTDNQKPENKQAPVEAEYQDLFMIRVHGFIQWCQKDLKKHSAKIIVLLVIFAAGFIGWSSHKSTLSANLEKDVELLGAALNHVYVKDNDSAKIALEAIVQKTDVDAVVLAKASLLLGNAYYVDREFDKAIMQYQNTVAKAGEIEVLSSSAEHGIAASYIQKKEYDKAISALDAFIAKYAARTGDLKARYAGEEPQDKVALIADAMWKLALCYQETGKADQAKATCDKIVKIYAGTTQATQAKKLLAVL